MKKVAFAVLWLLTGLRALATPTDTLAFRGVSVGVGGGHVALFAEAMAPLRYVGGRFVAQAGYTHRRISGRQTDWSLAYYTDGFPESRAVTSGEKLTQQGYELSYATLFRMSNRQQRLGLRVGPSALLLVNTKTYPFLPYNRDLDLPIELWARMGPILRADYRLHTRLVAHVTVFVPLLSLYGSPSQFVEGVGKSDQPRSTGWVGDYLLVSSLKKQPGGRIQTAIDLLSRQQQTRRGYTKLTAQLRYAWEYYSVRKYLNRQTGAGILSLHVWVNI